MRASSAVAATAAGGVRDANGAARRRVACQVADGAQISYEFFPGNRGCRRGLGAAFQRIPPDQAHRFAAALQFFIAGTQFRFHLLRWHVLNTQALISGRDLVLVTVEGAGPAPHDGCTGGTPGLGIVFVVGGPVSVSLVLLGGSHHFDSDRLELGGPFGVSMDDQPEGDIQERPAPP